MINVEVNKKMIMDKEIKQKYISFEQAKWLREKGFDEKCSHYYINDYSNFKHDGILYKTKLPNEVESDSIFQFVKRNKQPHIVNSPEQWQVVDWLFEKYYYSIEVEMNIPESGENDGCYVFNGVIKVSEDYKLKILFKSKDYPNREKAYSAAFDYIKANNLI